MTIFCVKALANRLRFSIMNVCVIVSEKARGTAQQMLPVRGRGGPNLLARGAGGFPGYRKALICQKESMIMTYSQQVQILCPITKVPDVVPHPSLEVAAGRKKRAWD